jgi:hypothetical protein
MWTIDAIRCGFSPAAPTARALLAFTAAEKKSIHHWARIAGGAPVERRALPAGERELVLRCADLIRRLGESAVALAPPRQAAFAGRAESAASAAVAAALRSARIAPEAVAAYEFEGGLALVHQEREDLAALCASLPAVARAAGRRIVLYAPPAAACAPIFGGLRELWREPTAVGMPVEPAFLREQFLYEALHGGAELRLRASRGSDAEGRRQCSIRLARWLTFRGTGRLLRSDAEAFAAAPPADPADTGAWFSAASLQWQELRALLETASLEPPAR